MRGWFDWFTWWDLLPAGTIAACVAIWIYVPPLRKWAYYVGGVVAAAFVIYTKGRKDGAKDVRKEWDRAETKAEESGRDARARAERDAARGVRDKRDRDDL